MLYTAELKKVELKRLHLAFVDGQVDRICTDFGSVPGHTEDAHTHTHTLTYLAVAVAIINKLASAALLQ